MSNDNESISDTLTAKSVMRRRNHGNTTHGESRTKLHKVWAEMRNRCNNSRHKQYADWGGRGIKVCQEWDSFAAFRDWAMSHGYEEGLSIDRENNSLGYSPQNCRWATRNEQNNNKRQYRRANRLSVYGGVWWKNANSKWECGVAGRPNGMKRYCGLFATEIEAALHWDRIVSEEIPSRSFRNFPALTSLFRKQDSTNGR